MNSNNYIMKFGKFKNMRAVDIAQIKTVNKLGNQKNNQKIIRKNQIVIRKSRDQKKQYQ